MKKIILMIFAVGACLYIGQVPSNIVASTSQIEVVLPYYKQYPSQLVATGVMENYYLENIYTDTSFFVTDVFVDKYQWVDKNEVIAAGKDISGIGTMLPIEYQAVFASSSYEDIASMFDQYSEFLGDGQSYIDKCPTIFITAPTSGTVENIDLHTEEILDKNSLVATVNNNAQALAQVQLTHEYSNLVSVGAGVSLYCKDGVQYLGRVTAVNLAGKNPVVSVKINSSDSLPQHMEMVECFINTNKFQPLVVLPFSAINQDENMVEFVNVYKDGLVVKQEVITGQEFRKSVEILMGIARDDLVLLGENPPISESYNISNIYRYNMDDES